MNISSEFFQVNLLTNLYNILSRKRKRQLILISFLIIFNGIAEIFTLSSIEPLLTIISNQNFAVNGLIKDLYNFVVCQSCTLYLLQLET